MNILPAKFHNYNIALSKTEIQIFHLSVNLHREQLESYENILQPEELARTSSFFKREDRERFVIGRGVLKHLSGLYLNSFPQLIEIVSDQNKKPIIKGCENLHFNVSHSKNYIVFAFSHYEIGIDVEYINDEFDYKPIAKECFTKNEIQYLEESDKPVKEFFKLWTRKEALLKATGKGLSDDMNKIDCLNQTCVSTIRDPGYDNYTIESFEIEKDYVGGIAYKDSEKKLSICMI